ncbi:MAG: hypothetical protein WC890_01275 [Candidatus Margulisiibacteriota bacterium]
MKKLLLLVLVIVVSMACVAQAATKVAVPAKASGWVVGVENAMPYIRLMPDKDMSVDLGATATYTSSTAYTANVMARLNMKLADISAITTGWGVQLNVAQVQAAASTTSFSGSLLMSADYTVVSGVVVYGNLNLLTVNANNGAATLLTGSAPSVYTGIRVNI